MLVSNLQKKLSIREIKQLLLSSAFKFQVEPSSLSSSFQLFSNKKCLQSRQVSTLIPNRHANVNNYSARFCLLNKSQIFANKKYTTLNSQTDLNSNNGNGNGIGKINTQNLAKQVIHHIYQNLG